MSKKENITETQLQEKKVVTRYDRRMQKRKEQEAQYRKEKRRGIIVLCVIAAAVICFIASFPIRNYIAWNGTFVEVGGEKVSRVEFDYYYNTNLNTYRNQYGAYMSMMGIDLSGDLSTMQYSDYLSWQDYFDKMAIASIKQTKAIKKEISKINFSVDDMSKEWEDFEESLKKQASDSKVTVKSYVKSAYGYYATLGRIKGFVEDSILTGAYLDKYMEDNKPSDDDIVAYYEENKDEFDTIKYRSVQVNAELPTGPADSSEKEDGEEEYEPTEAEIETAMKEAEKKAQAAKATVAKEGDEKTALSKGSTTGIYSEWLYDSSRKKGDVTVIEDADNNRYYVLAFEERYLEEIPTMDARIIVTQEGNAQEIFDEWKNGDATEESFGQLFDKYDESGSGQEGGLVKGLTSTVMPEEIAEWLEDEARKPGDAKGFVFEDSVDYVIYYVGQNKVEWKLSIESTLLSNKVSEHLADLTGDMEVKDPDSNLRYLVVEAAQKLYEEQKAAEETAGTDTAK